MRDAGCPQRASCVSLCFFHILFWRKRRLLCLRDASLLESDVLLWPVIVKETRKYINNLEAVDDTPVPAVKIGVKNNRKRGTADDRSH